MKSDPCWTGYKMVGSKKKGGRTVPNCVRENFGMKTFEDYLSERGEFNEDHMAIAKGKMLDDEGSMIKNQLETIKRSIDLLHSQIKSDKMQIPAWIQAKIAIATDQITTCANYMASSD